MSFFLHKITISHFRNHAALRLDLTGAPAVVIAGPNGSGKTNILEAISLLAPGRGLRGADLLDMKNRASGPEDVWSVMAEIETPVARVRLGTGLDRSAKRRLVRIDGKDAKTQAELSSLLSIVWLTPQMDRIFQEGASGRRKFFDRLVFAFEPAHAARLARYDRNLRERLKLLMLEKPADEIWLGSLETQLAGDAVAIAASRLSLLEKLSCAVAEMESQSLFPAPRLSLSGWSEEETGRRPALDVEEELKERFRRSRGADRAAGKSHEGAHRTDLVAFHKAKDMPAAQSSTGEQKALLVSIVLAHARLMRAARGHAPLLLLDEALAHLDPARRDQLFSFLQETGSQVFLTGTDAGDFAAFSGALVVGAGQSGVAVRRSGSAGR